MADAKAVKENNNGNRVKTFAACIGVAIGLFGLSFGIGVATIGAPTLKEMARDNRAFTTENAAAIRALEVDRAVILEKLRTIELKLDKALAN